MKKLLFASMMIGAAITFGDYFDTAQANTTVNPTIQYSEAQFAACSPDEVSGVDSQTKRSHVGESATARARVELTPGADRAFDPRPGAIAFDNSGVHVNRPGKPQLRYDGIHVTKVSLNSAAHRGRSLRAGRRASVTATLVATTIAATPECYLALGLFDMPQASDNS